MSLERICNREVIVVRPETTLLEVARLMHTRHVGSVVVVEEHRPIGILTDRDIVVKVVAAERDPKTVQASEVMVSNPALMPSKMGF